MKMFEDTIANKAKESVPSNPQPNVMDETTDENPNFVGYNRFDSRLLGQELVDLLIFDLAFQKD